MSLLSFEDDLWILTTLPFTESPLKVLGAPLERPASHFETLWGRAIILHLSFFLSPNYLKQSFSLSLNNSCSVPDRLAGSKWIQTAFNQLLSCFSVLFRNACTALPLRNVGISSSLKVFSLSSLLGRSVCLAMGPFQYTLPWQNRLMNTPSGATHNSTPLSRWQRRRFIASAKIGGRDTELGEGKESCWAVQGP